MDFVKRGANISHKYKFVWTAPAKVASRSVRDIFLKYCDLNPDWPSDEHPSNFTHVNNWPEEAGDDYIHIANKFENIFIENIPKLSIFTQKNEARRFIWLIDAIYE